MEEKSKMLEVVNQEKLIMLEFGNSVEGLKQFVITWELEYKQYTILSMFEVLDKRLRVTLKRKL